MRALGPINERPAIRFAPCNLLHCTGMDFRHILTLAGLFCDLMGAVLLSIPMVWNTHAAAHSIIRFLRRTRYFLYGDVMSDSRALRHAARMRGEVIDESEIIASMDLARLLAIPTLFVICFIVIEFRLMQVVLTSPRIGQTGSSDIFYQLLVLAAVITAVAALIYFLLRAPVMLVHGLLWIARGNHERRIGIIGLAVLCVGFLLQAWVNILP